MQLNPKRELVLPASHVLGIFIRHLVHSRKLAAAETMVRFLPLEAQNLVTVIPWRHKWED